MRTILLLLACTWLATSTTAAAAPSPTPPPPTKTAAKKPRAKKGEGYTNPIIELVTMGAGNELLHRWGHAALCVVYDGEPERDVCHNYGAAFTTSVAMLGWDFLRGTAKFKVILQGYADMMQMYRGWDRSIWVQRLPFDQVQVNRMVTNLDKNLLEENRYYIYHHMWDNCATRLRDHINAVVGGALKKGGGKSTGVTFRDLARRGLAGKPFLLTFTTLGFGRGLDKEVTVWASMGHPDFLRSVVATKLGAKPEQLYTRRGKPLGEDPGYGHGYLFGLALLLGLALVGTQRAGRFERSAVVTATVVLTVLGSVLWLTALVSAVPELYLNEAVLVFWPTDVLLWKLKDRRLQLYLRVRIAALAVVSILLALGVLVQPLLTAVLLPMLVCLALSRLPIWPAKGEAPETKEAEAAPARTQKLPAKRRRKKRRK